MPRVRHWLILSGVFSLCCACNLLAAPADVRNGLDTLKELVGQLIRVEKAVHAARTEWQDQEAQLKREDELLQQRIARAEEKVGALAKARRKAQADRAEAEKKAKATEQALARFFPPVERAEASLRTLQRRLPPLLAETLKEEFAKLPKPNTPATQKDVGERLRLVLALTTEIEQFDAAIHAGRLILSPPDGKPREMEVLQFGLGAAYAVSADGQHAARGGPGAEAWQWQWQPELAEPIRVALEVYRKKRPAEFVQLPIRVGGTEQ
jgi:hypothetical protein